MFEFADRHRGAYSASLHHAVCPFYCDVNGYQVNKTDSYTEIFCDKTYKSVLVTNLLNAISL